MTKKKAILLVLGGEAVIYLFLLVGLPLFTEWLYSFSECTGGRYFNTALGGLRWVLYGIPLLIGVWVMLMIWQKKEAKQ